MGSGAKHREVPPDTSPKPGAQDPGLPAAKREGVAEGKAGTCGVQRDSEGGFQEPLQAARGHLRLPWLLQAWWAVRNRERGERETEAKAKRGTERRGQRDRELETERDTGIFLSTDEEIVLPLGPANKTCWDPVISHLSCLLLWLHQPPS